jgi:hypothetical protein
MRKQSKREREMWAAFVEQREGEKKAKTRKARSPSKVMGHVRPTQAELEAALDDLVQEKT